jgi:hypothetical protein
MAKSKYATEFGELEARKMSKGFAPDAPQSQWLGVKRTSYELHHKTPISQGGAVYDLYNIEIVTPRFHKEVLEKAFHVGK